MVKAILTGRVRIVKLIAETLTELYIDGVSIVLLAALPTVNHDCGKCLTVFGRYASQYLTNKCLKVLLHVAF